MLVSNFASSCPVAAEKCAGMEALAVDKLQIAEHAVRGKQRSATTEQYGILDQAELIDLIDQRLRRARPGEQRQRTRGFGLEPRHVLDADRARIGPGYGFLSTREHIFGQRVHEPGLLD